MIGRLGAAALAVALGLAVSGAGAEQIAQHGGTADEQAACTPDVFRLCASQIPNESRIVACLKHNKAKLRPACRKVFS